MLKLRFRDRRRAQRVDVRHLAKYRLFDEKGKAKPIISVAKNVSATGLLIQTKEPLKVGACLELEINFPPFKDPIKAQVKVAWMQKLKKIDYYRSGLSFVDIDKEHRQRILDYIEYVNRVSKSRFSLFMLKDIISKLLKKNRR